MRAFAPGFWNCKRPFPPAQSPSRSPAATRVQALQARWVQLRARVALLLTERGAEMAETPGGASGLLMLDFKGKESTPVYRVDTDLVSLLCELRAHEQQAATELEQWKIRTVVETTVAVTPAAVALSQLFTTEQLKELERTGARRPDGSQFGDTWCVC